MEVMRTLATMPGKEGALAPMYVDPTAGRFHGRHISFGARSDSYYEYLLKQWLLTGKRHAWLLQLYTDTMRDVRDKLLQRSAQNGLLYIAELDSGVLHPKMDHLVCFMPGERGLRRGCWVGEEGGVVKRNGVFLFMYRYTPCTRAHIPTHTYPPPHPHTYPPPTPTPQDC